MDGMGYMLSSLRMWMDSSFLWHARFLNTEKFLLDFINTRFWVPFICPFDASYLKKSFKAQKLRVNPSPILFPHPVRPPLRRVCLPTIWLIFMVRLVGQIYEFPWMVWETFWFHPNPRGHVAQILFTPSLCVASRADGRGRAGGTESLFGSDDHQTLRWRLGGNMNEWLGSSNSHPLKGESRGLVFGTCFLVRQSFGHWEIVMSKKKTLLVTVPDQSSLHSGPPNLIFATVGLESGPGWMVFCTKSVLYIFPCNGTWHRM